MLILLSLREGSSRFYELRTKIEGISEKMLSQTLRTLSRDGFVYRLVDESRPPKVSYGLTPLGVGLTDHLQKLFDWLRANSATVVAFQQQYDTDGARLGAD